VDCKENSLFISVSTGAKIVKFAQETSELQSKTEIGTFLWVTM